MKRFKNILCYTDGGPASRCALDRVVGLTARNQGRLTVVNVLEELPRELMRLAAAMPSENLQDLAQQEARERMATLVAPFQKQVPTLETDVLTGKPFIEIIRAVLRRQHDLVVMTAERPGRLRERIFGSTSLHLMRKCPCPVWVIKPTRRPRFARILAAVDPDPLDVVRDGVNTKIMELATSLAALEESELHVVHAWQICDPSLWRNWRERVTKTQADDWVEQTRVAHQQRLDALAGKFNLSGLNHRWHLVEGEAGDVIPKLAARQRIDLIVMGTLARAGLEGFFIGNTAETVLQHAACSILTIKPDGFVSPVKLA